MFRFGFADPAAASHADAEPAATEAGQHASENAADGVVAAEEVLASEGVPTGAQDIVTVSPTLSLIKGMVSNAQAASILSDERVASNDLLPGVYEGGFKTWEGGVDLAQFLASALAQQEHRPQQEEEEEEEEQQQQQQQKQQQQQQQQHAVLPLELGPGSRVIELGCGSGLPGLVALWAGAEVHFQDYNRSVLTTLTIQNVAANANAWATRRQAAAVATTAASVAAAAGSAGEANAASRARYLAGSWDAMPGLLAERGLGGGCYDLVLTAETIYSLEAMRSLYACIKACLRTGRGAAALVAAKSYYFGVGGGTAAFRRLVQQDGCFSCEAVAVLDDGLSNKREILLLVPLDAVTTAKAGAAQQER